MTKDQKSTSTESRSMGVRQTSKSEIALGTTDTAKPQRPVTDRSTKQSTSPKQGSTKQGTSDGGRS